MITRIGGQDPIALSRTAYSNNKEKTCIRNWGRYVFLQIGTNVIINWGRSVITN